MYKSILILMMYVVSTSAAAEWFHITSSSDRGGYDSYIATTTIHRTGNSVTLQILNDFKNPRTIGPKPFLSALWGVEFDCEHQRVRGQNLTTYSGNMAKGDVIDDLSGTSWKLLNSRSVLAQHFKYACNSEVVRKYEPPGVMRGIVFVIETIKIEYVDAVDDSKLVAGCRDGINRQFGESLNFVALPENENASSLETSARDQIANALATIKQQNSDVPSEMELIHACLSGMLTGLDAQSDYLSKDEFKKYRARTFPLGGIGVELHIVEELPRIILAIHATPAHQAGLKSGDVIVSTDSAPTRGVPLEEIISRLQGPVGSTITLEVLREGVAEPLRVSLTRDVIQRRSVQWKWVGPGYAYLHVLTFQSATVGRLAQAIQTLYAENRGELKGLILDVRNNSGGLLNACIGVSAAFLPQGKLITAITGRAADSRKQLYANSGHYLQHIQDVDPLKDLPSSIKRVPMIVLVNHVSAACSEIVAAALQDHKRAKIFGTRTSGQGTLATIYSMKDGTALKLTRARLYRPNGETFDKFGVTPDMILDEMDPDFHGFGSEEDVQVGLALKHLSAQANRKTLQRPPAPSNSAFPADPSLLP